MFWKREICLTLVPISQKETYASEIQRLWHSDWSNESCILECFERMLFPGGERFESEQSVGIWWVGREHHEKEKHEHDVQEAASGSARVLHRYDQHPCKALLWAFT
jgi:hypothetical protein